MRTEKGGKPDERRQPKDHTRIYLGRMVWEESADERWRPVGRGAAHVDSCSVPGRDVRGVGGCKEREKRH